MPVKKPTAAKKAVAKKPAAKSAAPALAKSVSKTKSTATKKSASAEPPKNVETLTKSIATAIKGGQFDSHISLIDEAVNARISARAAEQKKSAAPAKKPAESKTVSSPPKRKRAPVENIKPESGKTYKLDSPAKLAGAKVKFIRPKADDENKVVVEMVTEKPGYPKGKRVLAPLSALRKV